MRVGQGQYAQPNRYRLKALRSAFNSLRFRARHWRCVTPPSCWRTQVGALTVFFFIESKQPPDYGSAGRRAQKHRPQRNPLPLRLEQPHIALLHRADSHTSWRTSWGLAALALRLSLSYKKHTSFLIACQEAFALSTRFSKASRASGASFVITR
jgi:hypothetical protein